MKPTHSLSGLGVAALGLLSMLILAQLPVPVVVVHNPNVEAPYESVGVHHYQISNVQIDDTLTQDSITITPTTTNAWIWEYFADGHQHSRSYGPDGELLGEQFVRGGPEPLGPGETFVPRRSLAWRWVIPPVAALFGLGVVFLLRRAAPRRGVAA